MSRPAASVAVATFLATAGVGWILRVNPWVSLSIGLVFSLFLFFGLLWAARRPPWALRRQRRHFLVTGSLLAALGAASLVIPMFEGAEFASWLALLSAASFFVGALYLSRRIKREARSSGRK